MGSGSAPISYSLLLDRGGTDDFRPIDPSPECENLLWVLEIRVEPAGADPNGSLTAAFMRLEGKIAPLKSRKSNKGWYIGNQVFEIIWDISLNETRTYHMLSLGRIHLGLILTQNETNKEFCQRVGITKLPERGSEPWTSELMTDEIVFI
ncbi:hypothetical protein BDZ45DRAFT_743198 [Acephala macrosclerotiorum]|nr:hypothetical protein BDZ45DRAFT_743198 [Acephala macrosclerotiorum]